MPISNSVGRTESLRMAENYELIYFNKRGGGEIIRLVFVTAGVNFKDTRLNTDEWQKIKPELPMKALPCLKIRQGEKTNTYCQSGAIAKYLARKFGLYSDSAEINFLIDEMYDSVGDVRSPFIQAHFSKDENEKKELNEKLVQETLPKFASFFEKRIKEFGSHGYAIGAQLTLADLSVFNLVDCCVEMGLESLWKPYPNLLKHREHVMKNERLANWLQSRPKTDV